MGSEAAAEKAAAKEEEEEEEVVALEVAGWAVAGSAAEAAG